MASTLTASGETTCEDEPMLPVQAAEDTDNDAPPDIPDDAIYNILTRLPPSSVTRSKAICKSWLSMISGRSFKPYHRAAWGRRRRRTASILLFDGSARYPATVVDEAGAARLVLRRWRAEPRHGYTVQNCCGALACLRTGRGGAQLLNPATGESLGLGNFRYGDSATWTPAEHLPWYCLGRSASTGEHKVVRLDVRLPFSSSPHVTCEVLGVGRGRPRWKEVGVWGVTYCPADRGVHISGVVHYLARSTCDVIVSFDLDTEERSEIRSPATDGVVASLSELDGQLCVSVVPSGDAARRGPCGRMVLWLLGDDVQRRDGGGKAWTLTYSIELDGTPRRAPRPLLRRGRCRVLMKRADGSIFYYDDGHVELVEVVVYQQEDGRRLTAVTADVFEESLLSLRDILRG
ncbi:hypothetical protein BAE44_0025253 [Dichanthelium oligosanthes]|uniref:Uncharacterized protein n=1 Tax=Dichanthelium oligosanthes TaxID=888268 RepID=A0A1E5ULL3_9POAL|nr:hypothetical protein BAE44_0025253 [Dichanthelium oligosanthes]